MLAIYIETAVLHQSRDWTWRYQPHLGLSPDTSPVKMLGAFYKSEQFINCAAHFINPYTFTWFRATARARVRARVRASKGVFFTEAPAEFQHHSHVNCMIV